MDNYIGIGDIYLMNHSVPAMILEKMQWDWYKVWLLHSNQTTYWSSDHLLKNCEKIA